MAYNEYEDKEALIENPSIPDKNKVKADDMNYLKYAVPKITNEIDDTYTTNLIKGKNLFDYKLFETFTTTLKVITLNLKPNTQYTMSSDYLNTTTGTITGNLFITNSTSSPNTGSNNVYSGMPRTITTNADGIIKIHYRDYRSEYTNEATSYWYMLNEGSTALTYEAFVPNSIVVKGSNFTETIGIGTSVNSANRVNVLHSKNLFDEVWEYGGVNSTTGANENNGDNTRIRTKNYIEVSASSNYVLTFDATNVGSAGARIVLYNSNKEFISTLWYNTSSGNQWAFETTSATKYIRFTAKTDSGTWNLSNIQFMLNEGSSALPYEPYATPSIVVDNEEIYSKPVVLWTNPAPTSAFTSGNITLNDNISNYQYYEVIYKGAKNIEAYYNTARIPSGKGCRLIIPTYKNDFRALTYIGGTIATFGDGGSYATYGTNILTTDNDLVIPYQIIGYK